MALAALPATGLVAVVLVDARSPDEARPDDDARVPALEPVANRPILHHVLDGLLADRVDEIVLAGPAEALLDVRPHVRPYEPRFARIGYAPRRHDETFLDLLRRLVAHVGSAGCLIVPADGLSGGGLPGTGSAPSGPSSAGSSPSGETDLVLLLADDDALDGGPTDGGPTDGRASVGLFSPGGLARACALTAEHRLRAPACGPAPVTDLISLGHRISAAGGVVEVRPLPGLRRYAGRSQDLLELNRIALERSCADVPAAVRDANAVEGRVVVDPEATVTDSVLVGPCVIGAGAIVRSAYVGPYTAIGAGARVDGSEVERSIIGAGARVEHVGTRLVGSVLGPNARVCRSFALPRGLRLRIGAGAEISL